MPFYEYDKDYPFAAFITNLGKYNEGELVGEWVKFPTTYEKLQETFRHIGIGQEDDFGAIYEEWFITDYDCYVDGLYDKLGEYANLDELNYLASKLDEMSRYDYERFEAAMSMGDYTGSIQDMINLCENLDCYEVYVNIHDDDDLGRFYIEECGAMSVPEHLQNYIDYEAYGRDVRFEEGGEFTDAGYIYNNGSSFREYYDGDRDSIPEEYRVMSSPDGDELEEPDEPEQQEERLTVLVVDPQSETQRVFTPDTQETGEIIQTPRGSFHVTAMTKEQMEAAGYGFHHASDNGQYLIMTNGSQAYAINAHPQKRDNPLRTAEMTIEDDYDMIDGVINNGRRDDPTEKTSVAARLEAAKKECAEHKSPEKKSPSRNTPEHGEL